MTITVNYSHRAFKSEARTLHPGDLGFHENSGWTIEGDICKDYYTWVNEFVATHSDLGTVKGDFETEVTAESRAALDHFLLYHPYNEWDYYDI